MIGINYAYEEIAPTELVELTINKLYMDFTFKTTEDDFAWLSLTPLMGGELSRKDKIKESILLAKDE